MSGAQTYTGGCQCSAVRFEVAADISEPIACNCSRCGKVGSLLAFAPSENFILLSGADATTEFKFNKQIISHKFCKTCGIQSYSNGKGPGGADMVAVNVRCLDAIDPNAITSKPFDGRKL